MYDLYEEVAAVDLLNGFDQGKGINVLFWVTELKAWSTANYMSTGKRWKYICGDSYLRENNWISYCITIFEGDDV